MNFIRSLKTDTVFVMLVILAAIPLLMPYFKSGYFPTHDGEWAVVRLADMYRTVVQDHQIPARYSGYLNAGYGYPLFNFAYPHPYYMGLPLLAFGLGFTASVKSIFVASVVVSGIGMYLLSRRLWQSQLAGIVSAVLYLYAPYRMVDLYVRGSIGESVSFALFPLLLLSALSLAEKKPPAIALMIAPLLLGLLIGTHNIMTVYFVPLLFIFSGVYVGVKNPAAWRRFALAGLLGIGSAAYFWLPALYEKQFIWLSEIPIADRSLYFVTLLQMIIPTWGYGIPGASDGFTYQIGIGLLGTFLVAIIFFITNRQENRSPQRSIVIVLTSIVGVMMLMMMRFSSVVWEALPLVSEINYPWTLLSQIIWVIALIAGFFVTRGAWYRYAVIASTVVAVIVTIPYAKPYEYVQRGDEFYVTNDAVTTSSDEYLPLWVEEKPLARPETLLTVISGSGTATVNVANSTLIDGRVSMEEAGTIAINRLYYPGWEVFIDDMRVNPDYRNTFGVMHVPVDQGDRHITARFFETPVRMIANMISVLSLIASMLMPFAARRISTI